jgi:hypothetical protein
MTWSDLGAGPRMMQHFDDAKQVGKQAFSVHVTDDKGWCRAQPLAVAPHRFGRFVFDLEPLAGSEGPLHLVVAIEIPGRRNGPGAPGVGAGESANAILHPGSQGQV